jgi:hypothetical protein
VPRHSLTVIPQALLGKRKRTRILNKCRLIANMVMLHNIINQIKSNVLYYKYYNQQYFLVFTVVVTAHISGIDPIKFRSWDFFFTSCLIIPSDRFAGIFIVGWIFRTVM